MQTIDAERRIDVLRNSQPVALLDVGKEDEAKDRDKDGGQRLRERTKRKRQNEDDTDYEMRAARDRLKPFDTETQLVVHKSSVNAPLTDTHGHIDLFPQQHGGSSGSKNAEAEKEADRKKKELEDQYTMRFANAAGLGQELKNPWYSNSKALDPLGDEHEFTTKNVWGREDPQRKEREAARLTSNDPLALMRQGAAKVRQVEKEKRRWLEEREKEMQEMKEADRERKRRKKRHRSSEDDPEDFSLDRVEDSGPPSGKARESSHHKDPRRRSHRSRSRDRDKDRSRHRSLHRH